MTKFDSIIVSRTMYKLHRDWFQLILQGPYISSSQYSIHIKTKTNGTIGESDTSTIIPYIIELKVMNFMMAMCTTMKVYKTNERRMEDEVLLQ